MNLEKQSTPCEEEHNRLMKIINFRFPHQYKRIGILAALSILGFLVFYKFYGSNELLVKDLCRTVMLLLLLLASLSKDAVEDEYIKHIRSQSYILAFVGATVYSICLPLLSFFMDLLITKVQGDGSASFQEVSAFEVMFMLICFQLLAFETLKRFSRAQ